VEAKKMWKFVSNDFNGNFISKRGKLTTIAAIRATAMGIGRADRAMGLAFCTGAFRKKHQVDSQTNGGKGAKRTQTQSSKKIGLTKKIGRARCHTITHIVGFILWGRWLLGPCQL
jgi:hypothetical protein